MLPQRLPLCSRPSQDPYRILGKAARSSPQALEQRQLHIPGWLHISALSQLPPSTRWSLSHHSHTCSPCPGPCAQVCCPSRPGKEVPCAPTPPSPLQTAYLGKAEVQGQPWGWMAQDGQLLLLSAAFQPTSRSFRRPLFPCSHSSLDLSLLFLFPEKPQHSAHLSWQDMASGTSEEDSAKGR